MKILPHNSLYTIKSLYAIILKELNIFFHFREASVEQDHTS
jgi:hypothetical protein